MSIFGCTKWKLPIAIGCSPLTPEGGKIVGFRIQIYKKMSICLNYQTN